MMIYVQKILYKTSEYFTEAPQSAPRGNVQKLRRYLQCLLKLSHFTSEGHGEGLMKVDRKWQACRSLHHQGVRP